MTLLAAIAFLTRIPIRRPFTTEQVARAAAWFPLIGALLGLLYGALYYAITLVAPPLIAALLVLATEALLTGALHYDGLADMCDGFGGGRTRDDILRIMRDHTIGTYGATALILNLLLTAASLTALRTPLLVTTWLITAGAFGRWTILLLSRALPYARPNNAISSHITGRELIIGTATVAATAFLLHWQTLIAAAVALAITTLLALLARRKIGGITGDVLGATAQIVQTALLLTAVILNR